MDQSGTSTTATKPLQQHSPSSPPTGCPSPPCPDATSPPTANTPPPPPPPPPLWTTRLVFGTYNQSGANLTAQVNLALSRGFTHFDTASLYRNDAALGALLSTSPHNTLTTTKIHRAEHPSALRARLRASIAALGGATNISTVLLHRPLASAHYASLAAEASAANLAVGVSNFRSRDIRRLCDVHPPPALNQLEVHPFVPGLAVDIAACAARNIPVEAHTALARANFLSWPPLVALAHRMGASPAQVLLRFALQAVGAGGRVVVNSGCAAHLDELVVAAGEEGDRRWTLSEDVVAEMRGWAIEVRKRFYVHAPMPPVTPPVSVSEDDEEYVRDIVRLLREDAQVLESDEGGRQVSATVFALPAGFGTRSIKTDQVSRQIAGAMFPASRDPITLYIDLVKRLRGACNEQHKLFKEGGGGRSCARGQNSAVVDRSVVDGGDELSLEVLEPLAMPVTTAAVEELQPFFRYLSSDCSSAVPKEGGALFLRGCLFSDGRMDMCKQVVGSAHIAKLCEAVSVSRPGRVRHFLLGNNVSCGGDAEGGASALASLMSNNALAIETFYLAGNAINAEAMAIIGAALADNTTVTALWLKRNPLKAASAGALGEMLARNKALQLLDLHNTGLLDEGVEKLLLPLAADKALTLPLRHLYLGACGISGRGAKAIATFVSSPAARNLETLYLPMNAIGSAGAIEIATAFSSLAESGGRTVALKRLSFASSRVTSEALASIVDAAIACELVCLDIGWYKATRDLGERPNAFDSSALKELKRLVRTALTLKYLSVQYCGLSDDDIYQLRELSERINPDLRLDDGLQGCLRGKQSPDVIRAGLRHPKCVENIDSIYRGKA